MCPRKWASRERVRGHRREGLPPEDMATGAIMPVEPSTATDPDARSPGNTNAQSMSTLNDACVCDFEARA